METQEQQRQFVFSQTIVDKYKEVSDVINSVEPKSNVRKLTMKGLMQESFFHGASWVGVTNFIA